MPEVYSRPRQEIIAALGVLLEQDAKATGYRVEIVQVKTGVVWPQSTCWQHNVIYGRMLVNKLRLRLDLPQGAESVAHFAGLAFSPSPRALMPFNQEYCPVMLK